MDVKHMSVLVALTSSPHIEVFDLPCGQRNDVVSPHDVMSDIEHRKFCLIVFFL